MLLALLMSTPNIHLDDEIRQLFLSEAKCMWAVSSKKVSAECAEDSDQPVRAPSTCFQAGPTFPTVPNFFVLLLFPTFFLKMRHYPYLIVQKCLK